MIRHAVPVTLAIGATLAACLASSPFAGAAATCAPAHSTTLASDSSAAVYGKNGVAYVCLLATRQKTKLQGASPTADQFALGGKYVGWSSGPAHSIVTVMNVSTRAVANTYPLDTNNHVDKIVVKSSGAAAWASSPSGDNTYVEGTDRQNHPPDTFSDDTKSVRGSSLRSLAGHAITWLYTDGTSGTANLY